MLEPLRHWWDRRREEAAVRRRPIPDDLWKRTLVRYPFLRDPHDRAAGRLRRMTSLFLDLKEFSAVPPARTTNDVVVAVAAQACLPVLQLGLNRYAGFVGVVLQPAEMLAARAVRDHAGVVHEFDERLVGEYTPGGPITLSWRDVRAAGRDSEVAYNVVIHEFVHLLDMADGMLDGVPVLDRGCSRAEWTDVLRQAYERFVQCARVGTPSAVDDYGATAPEEFFAVTTEAFFVKPIELREEMPALYALYARYYRQDPAAAR